MNHWHSVTMIGLAGLCLALALATPAVAHTNDARLADTGVYG